MINMVWRTAILFLLSLMNFSASACTACFGQSDSKLAEGMSMGILTLLIVVVGVLGGVASFFIYLARRSAQFPQPGNEIAQNFSENPTKA
jgi:hypothetical protein